MVVGVSSLFLHVCTHVFWIKKHIYTHIFVSLGAKTIKKMIRIRLYVTLLCMSVLVSIHAVDKQWTVADGLPTGEVHQIVELPNGQMLVNCEGVFCLSDGKGFQTVPCNYNLAYRMPHYLSGYGQQWQGDSLLWLHDFYRIYLFDARSRSFRYDVEKRLTEGLLNSFSPSSASVTDRQGGQWKGTLQNGIIYQSPPRQIAEKIEGNHPLIDLARSTTDSHGSIWRCKSDGLECETNGVVVRYNKTNVLNLPYDKTTFITELPDRRFLLCDSLCYLGYFYPERKEYVLLNNRLPVLGQYRHLVGACVVDDEWTLVYSQNGAFMLNTKADTIAPLSAAKVIERYTDKYNCVVRDSQKRLWIGTQNGLFCEGRSIAGLANNCIRSLLPDAGGNIWVGTSCGISKIINRKSPILSYDVVNFSPDDGIPAVSMMERAACLTDDGHLLFVITPTYAVQFLPEWLSVEQQPLSVVITAMSVNGEPLPLQQLTQRITLAHHQNYLIFQFSALNYATPSHTRYRYRLLGLENEWQHPVTHDGCLGEVEYRALPPGTYTFEVQAAIDDGKWGEPTRQVVTIRPPFWLTWWAKTLYALLGILLVAALAGIYLRRKQQKMERENDNRVNQLFELREEARHQFAEATNVDPQKIGLNSEEQQLTERMLKAIENHMSDADYGVDQLAQDVFMSRSALYTKLRNMLGISPADFIRNVRLKHAANLLTDTQLPIGEIADLVGYNTHKAFATNFKKMFGMLPSEFRMPKGLSQQDEEQS